MLNPSPLSSSNALGEIENLLFLFLFLLLSQDWQNRIPACAAVVRRPAADLLVLVPPCYASLCCYQPLERKMLFRNVCTRKERALALVG
jgi:hypothetical protein